MFKDKIEYIKEAEELEIFRQKVGVIKFHVYAYPANKRVYTSSSRANVNWYVKGLKEKYDVEVTFAESTPGKSLEYDYNYSPIEYFVSLILFSMLFAYYLINGEGFSFFDFVLLFFVFYFIRRFRQSYGMEK